MNKIKLSDGTIYSVCREQWNDEHIGFTVITDENIGDLLNKVKDSSLTKIITWLDSNDNVIGVWNNFTDLKAFNMQSDICTGIDYDEFGKSKGNTYADCGYMIMLDKIEPTYVSKEEYDELVNAMLELASIVGGES